MRFGSSTLIAGALLGLSSLSHAQERATIPLAPGVLVTPTQNAAADSIARAYAARVSALKAQGDTTSGRYVTPARRSLYVAYVRDVRQLLTPVQRSAFDVWFDAAFSSFDARRRLMAIRAP